MGTLWDSDKLHIDWLETGDTRGLYQKFCLMQSAQRGEVVFHSLPLSSFSRLGFERSDLLHFKEGFSFLKVRYRKNSRLVILDNKDSFFNISPLIEKADLYFLGAYSPTIVESQSFPAPYSWQTETDLAPYRSHFKNVVERYGLFFSKIVRSIPMPMIMHPPLRTGVGNAFTFRRFALIGFALAFDRWTRKRRATMPLFLERAMFSVRYQELLALRKQRLKYDIVASDTLWAWPDHRAHLYHEISRLPNQRHTLTRLSAPVIGKSWPDRLSPAMLEFVMNKLAAEQDSFKGGFENLLASSRLNVFACGKHWGWRQIGFVALLCGTPILMDEPLFKPYFDFESFNVWYTRDQWQELPEILSSIDEDVWWQVKKHNQGSFDRFLAPEPVARYMISIMKSQFVEKQDVV